MSRRTTILALGASLALNMFLIAGVATVLILRGWTSQGRPGVRAPLREAARMLEPGPRATFVTLLKAQGRSVRAANRQARDLRLETWGGMGDANFDPALAKARLAQARALNQASRGQVEDAVIDFLATLPVETRGKVGLGVRGAIVANNPPAKKAQARPKN